MLAVLIMKSTNYDSSSCSLLHSIASSFLSERNIYKTTGKSITLRFNLVVGHMGLIMILMLPHI
jgi:hypothetical protein